MSKPSPPSKSSRIDLNDKHSKEELLGTLIVVLLKARNLLDRHSFRKSDVFAQAILNGIQKRTHVDIKGGQHPEWDGEVRFPILKSTAAKHRKMEISCYSVEPRSEDLMGQATLDISETLRTGEFDDWVQLEVDGVARGELYLEMTYYANSPAPTPAAPNKLLSAVLNQSTGLTRRPSKLSPVERLSRLQPQPSQGPAQGHPQYQGYPQPHEYPQQRPQGNGPSKLSAISSSTRPSDQVAHTRNDSLTMPGGYPDSSSGSPPKPQAMHYAQHQQPAPVSLPTILRPGPGGAASSPTPIPRPQNGLGHDRYPSDPSFPGNTTRPPQGSPPNSPNPYLGSSPSVSQPSSSPPRNPYISGSTTPPNPYIVGSGAPLPGQLQPGAYPPSAISQSSVAAQPNAVKHSVVPPVQSQNPYFGYRLSGQPPAGAPILWQDNRTVSSHPPSNGTFSFPNPTMSHGRDPALYGYADHGHLAHHRTTSGGSVPQNLSVDYSQRPPPSREDADRYLQARYQTPLPLPPDAARPKPTPTATHQPQHVQAPESMPTHAPSPPPKTATPTVDKSRLEALRWAEEEAARRREQELKDLELAMKLDREFNLQE